MSFNQILPQILLYYGYIVLPIGIISNIFSILILSQKTQRRMTINFYLTALSVSDVFVLSICLVDKWLRFVYNIRIRNTSIFLCKALPFSDKTFLSLSSWIIAIITTERAIAVSSPLGHNFTRNRKKVKNFCVLFIAIFVIGLVYSPVLFYYKFTERIIANNETSKTICHEIEPEIYERVKYVIFYCMFCFIPQIVCTVCVYFIVKHLLERRKFLTSQSQIHDDHINQNNRNMGLILSINILFFVFTVPFSLTGMLITFTDKTTEFHKDLVPIYTFVHLFSYTNSVLNFFVYIASGSSFRREFTNMCRKVNTKQSFKDSLKTVSSRLTPTSSSSYRIS
uniref:G-protein coupled receptors family 1 profile domain-containing protein n=1 Tax=Octopus bimaculoides TaxID=37653 RepID=A0A0L8IA41_OCTBM